MHFHNPYSLKRWKHHVRCGVDNSVSIEPKSIAHHNNGNSFNRSARERLNPPAQQVQKVERPNKRDGRKRYQGIVNTSGHFPVTALPG